MVAQVPTQLAYVHACLWSMQAQDKFISTLARLLDAEDNEDSENSDLNAAEITKHLHFLSQFPVSIELLNDTDAGEQVSSLEKEHPDQGVRDAAQSTLKAWRASVLASQLGAHLQDRGNVSIPSSSCSGLVGVYGKDASACNAASTCSPQD